MLIYTNKPGDWIHIEPRNGVSRQTPLSKLFARGHIRILVVPISPEHAKLSIEVPDDFEIRVTDNNLGS